MNATDGLTENDGHEIGGQDMYRLKIDYITMQCAILFKTTAEYKSHSSEVSCTESNSFEFTL